MWILRVEMWILRGGDFDARMLWGGDVVTVCVAIGTVGWRCACCVCRHGYCGVVMGANG